MTPVRTRAEETRCHRVRKPAPLGDTGPVRAGRLSFKPRCGARDRVHSRSLRNRDVPSAVEAQLALGRLMSDGGRARNMTATKLVIWRKETVSALEP